MSEYYKSLISDEEVMQELLKESQCREEQVTTTDSSRLKPNLNFFQRTVNNLISNNNRIDKNIDTFKADFIKCSKPKKLPIPFYKYESVSKPLDNYAFDRQFVSHNKIHFIKSSDSRQTYITNIKNTQNFDLGDHRNHMPRNKICASQHSKDATYKISHLRKIIDDISTESDDTDSDSDVQFVNASEKKKTCEPVPKGCQRSINKNQQNKTLSMSKDSNIICLSSDDSNSDASDGVAKRKLQIKKMVKPKRKKSTNSETITSNHKKLKSGI